MKEKLLLGFIKRHSMSIDFSFSFFPDFFDALLTIIMGVDRLDDVFINYFQSTSTYARFQHTHYLETDRFFADLKMCKRDMAMHGVSKTHRLGSGRPARLKELLHTLKSQAI